MMVAGDQESRRNDLLVDAENESEMVSDSSSSLRGTLSFEERHTLIQRVARMSSKMLVDNLFLELFARSLGEDEPDRMSDFSLSHLEALSLEELYRLERRLIQAQNGRIRILVEVSRRRLRECEERSERLHLGQLGWEEERLAYGLYSIATEELQHMGQEQLLIQEEQWLEEQRLATEAQDRLLPIRQRQIDLEDIDRLLTEVRHDWVRVIDRDRLLLEERRRHKSPSK